MCSSANLKHNETIKSQPKEIKGEISALENKERKKEKKLTGNIGSKTSNIYFREGKVYIFRIKYSISA